MITNHQKNLVTDLKLQPSWLTSMYIVLGFLTTTLVIVLGEVYFLTGTALFLSGALIALGIEKKVNTQLRNIAQELLKKQR